MSVLVDIVVPARNEAERIGAAIAALVESAAELRRARPGDDARITVVLDDCHDETARIVRAIDAESTSIDVLEVGVRSVGGARARGAARALRMPSAAGSRWIANTDADSRVPLGWLTQQADACRDGVDVLIGTVVPDVDDIDEDTLAQWRAAQRGTTPLGEIHGANLGIAAAAYSQLGGFEAVPEHEDVDLVARARAFGLVVDATLDDPVVTSGRLDGRTPGGYAGHLRATYADPASDSVSADHASTSPRQPA